MAEFASKGVAGSGLGLGIAGTALGLLNGNGMLGNLFGNGHGCSENTIINRYELGQANEIAALKSGIALRDANTYNDQKLLEVYKYFDGKLEKVNERICASEKEQAIFNAKVESGLDVIATQVRSINNTIANITKTVIPNSSVCPGWGEICIQTKACPTTTTGTGTT